MLDVSTLVFISYSRVDSAFVDRLEADLQARAISTWVDRKNLQGGQEWQDQIQQALEHARVVLVVLTPEAVASRNARREYRFALSQGRPVIPVMLRPCPSVPMELNDIQWVSFVDDYNKGLQDLLVALTSLPASLSAQSVASHPAPVDVADDSSMSLVTARPAPRAQIADLNALYRQGVKARAEGDLEGAALAWQQVLDRDMSFGGGSLSSQMRTLNQELRPARLQRLRQRAHEAARAGEWGQVVGTWQAYIGIDPMDAQARQALLDALRSQAEQAHKRGQWKEEIGAWDALQELISDDQQARERIPIAMKNQECAWHYETAQQFLNDGDAAAARSELVTLWQAAPYYGDPDGLAPAIGLSVPLDYETAKAARLKQEAEEREAILQEKMLREEHDRAMRRQNRRLLTGLIGTVLIIALLVASGLAIVFGRQASTLGAAVTIVTNTNDNGAGSLRDALDHAHDGSVIVFDSGVTGTITLTSGQLVISHNLVINGPANPLSITGGTSRAFEVGQNHVVTISNLTITGSHDASSGGGGGILMDSFSSLTLVDTTIENNTTTGDGGGIEDNGGILSVVGSPVTNNTADKGNGGGIDSKGGIIAINGSASTITNNTASRGDGGGIYLDANSACVKYNGASISSNTAPDVGGSGAMAGNCATGQSS